MASCRRYQRLPSFLGSPIAQYRLTVRDQLECCRRLHLAEGDRLRSGDLGNSELACFLVTSLLYILVPNVIFHSSSPIHPNLNIAAPRSFIKSLTEGARHVARDDTRRVNTPLSLFIFTVPCPVAGVWGAASPKRNLVSKIQEHLQRS
jgi:hypothetical protein